MNRHADASAFFLIILFLLVLVALLALAISQQPQPTSITTTQITLKAEPNMIDWGNLTQGETAQRTIIIRNVGNVTTNPLNMTSNCTVGNLTWNAEGVRVNAPNDSYPATFTLKTYPNATTGPFNFNIIISG